jgi:hypothetical protein
LAAAAMVDSLGNGLYLAGSALFFTRGLGFSVGSVGLGLSVAGVLGLLGSARVGRLADRFGPREVFMAMMTVQGLAVASYVLVHNVVALIAAATLAALCRQGSAGANGALVGRFGGENASSLRSYLHAINNVGIAAGAALAGLAIAIDTHAAYLAVVLADAATFLAAAGIAATLPRVEPLPQPSGVGRGGRAVRDRRYLAMTFLNGVTSLQFVVSGYLLPLWVLLHTQAPHWFSSQLLLLNTVLVAAFQVRVSNRYRGLDRAARAYRLGGVFVAGGCVLFAASTYGGTLIAVAVLLLAMLTATCGELLTQAGSFGMSFAVAPPSALGEYQAVWAAGPGAAFAVGPGLLTVICLRGGTVGWVGLAALMLLTSATLAATALRATTYNPDHREAVPTPS